MAESGLHRGMKAAVTRELLSEGYLVYEEPLFPPTETIWWWAYRPDLVGIRVRDGARDFAVVECETHPNTRRFVSKNYGTLWVQPTLFNQDSLRRILVIPRGKLTALDMKLRYQWEIWVFGGATATFKIPQIALRPRDPRS